MKLYNVTPTVKELGTLGAIPRVRYGPGSQNGSENGFTKMAGLKQIYHVSARFRTRARERLDFFQHVKLIRIQQNNKNRTTMGCLHPTETMLLQYD